jgi:tetratricopeptide (TPR) repeat protein
VKSGDPSRAEPHFRKAADLMPGKPQPWHMLGLCRQLAGDEAEALRFWDRALQRDPDFMPARFERGKHYLVAYAARSAPPPARIVEGRVRFGPAESGALDLRTKGEADLRAVKPERSEAAFLEGALAYGDGRFAAAAAALARYVEAESWDPEGQALLGLALYHAREFDRAIGPLSAAIRVQPRPEWRRARANAYHCLGRYADSIADNEALGDLCNLGHALHGAGRVEEAEAAFTKALEKDPQHARAANGRGISRWARRDFPGAEEDFQLAIRIAPAFLEAIFNLGLLKWRLGRFREAEEDFDFAVQIDPGWADAWAWRAAARQMEGRKGEAERDYRKAMELDPANPEHPFALAKMIKSPELVRKALEIGGPAWPRIEEARGILREWEK